MGPRSKFLSHAIGNGRGFTEHRIPEPYNVGDKTMRRSEVSRSHRK